MAGPEMVLPFLPQWKLNLCNQ